MKKLSVIFAVLAALALIGCAGGGGGKAAGDGAPPMIIDLGTLKIAKIQTADANSPINIVGDDGLGFRNTEPFARKYAELLLLFPEPLDLSEYARATINCKYFNGEGEEIKQGDSNAMVCLVRDINGDKRGPPNNAGGNIALKEFNVGGFSGIVSSDKGVRFVNSTPISAILFQSSGDAVKFIEVTEIIFHNGNLER